MHQHRHLKALRGALTAAFAVAVALLFHVLAGGAVPGAAGILIPLALALPVSVAVSAKRLSLIRLSISVLVSQALFHTLFVFGTVPFASHEGHANHGAPTMAGAVLPADAAHVHEHLIGGPVMLASHLVAAALTIAALHRGEAAVKTVLAAAARVLGTRRARLIARLPHPPVEAPKTPVPDAQATITPQLCVIPAHARRGPPLALSI